ncbi:MAG: MBL fold metallo-hydrolase [Pyrinomonadaceae bacterium]
MKLQLLPTTFDEAGCATRQQHLSCIVIDDSVAIDAGSLAMAASEIQRERIRNIVLTHAHLDHIAGLPLFVDDLFATLREPICVYATAEVIKILENHIFNWSVYPRFTELKNKNGEVLRYFEFEPEKDFTAGHLNFKAVEVNHKVPSVGFLISDSKTKIAMSGDTAEMSRFWQILNNEKSLDALLIECAFPDEMDDIAYSSHHLTPKKLQAELAKFRHKNCPVYAVNLKPIYREQISRELCALGIENLEILQVGRIYNF